MIEKCTGGNVNVLGSAHILWHRSKSCIERKIFREQSHSPNSYMFIRVTQLSNQFIVLKFSYEVE